MNSKKQRLSLTSLSLMFLLTSSINSNHKYKEVLEIIQSTKVISSLNQLTTNKPIVIGTHDGTFHCDEALAIGMLKSLPKYSDAIVLRTRNSELLNQCDIIVDVGATYIPENNRYDHHQREFNGVLDGFNTKLSSAGLVYKHFGKEILSHLTDQNHQLVDICYNKLYENFMEHIDAIDNGISISEDGKQRYHISTSLSSRVGTLNPSWNEESSADIINNKFIDAMLLTCSEFLLHANSLINIWWPARSIVQEAIEKRLSIHESGKIILLNQFCPWKDHLFEVEKDLGINEEILYALYEDTGGSWRIQAVPVDPNSFQSRKKLPSEWCGLRDSELSIKAGEAGAIFIHAGGFIGGHTNREGALNMAIKALSLI